MVCTFSEESCRVVRQSQRRKLKHKTFPGKQKKSSKNKLARVAKGSAAPLVCCCAGIACRLDAKVQSKVLGAEKIKR